MALWSVKYVYNVPKVVSACESSRKFVYMLWNVSQSIFLRKKIALLRKVVGESACYTELCTREYSDLNELTSSYNSTLTSLLDKHAPMKEKVVVCRQRLPWFNSEIKCAIRTRRKAERKRRRTKSQQDFRAFKKSIVIWRSPKALVK